MKESLTFAPVTNDDIRAIIHDPELAQKIRGASNIVVNFVGFYEPMISADGLVALFQLQGQIFSLDPCKKFDFLNTNEVLKNQLAVMLREFWEPIAQAANQDL